MKYIITSLLVFFIPKSIYSQISIYDNIEYYKMNNVKKINYYFFSNENKKTPFKTRSVKFIYNENKLIDGYYNPNRILFKNVMYAKEELNLKTYLNKENDYDSFKKYNLIEHLAIPWASSIDSVRTIEKDSLNRIIKIIDPPNLIKGYTDILKFSYVNNQIVDSNFVINSSGYKTWLSNNIFTISDGQLHEKLVENNDGTKKKFIYKYNEVGLMIEQKVYINDKYQHSHLYEYVISTVDNFKN